MAAITFTACSAGTPSRSRPTSTFTNTSQGVVAASEYARAPSRSTIVGVRRWAIVVAAASGSEVGYTRIGAVIPRRRSRKPSPKSATPSASAPVSRKAAAISAPPPPQPSALTTAKSFRAGPTSCRTARTFAAAAPRSISSVVGRGSITRGSGGRTPIPLGHVEVEEPGGVEPEHLRAGVVTEPAHRALDRLRGVRPRALVMRVVIAPQEVVHEVVALGQRQSHRIFLERGEAVHAVVVARHVLELRAHPEVVLAVGLVHGIQHPWQPADARLDGGELELREALEHAGGAEIR